MEDTTQICDPAEQICLKFQSIVSLYKDLQQSNSEEENLLLLGTLRDVKSFLSDREKQKRSIQDEDKNLGNLLDGLRNQAEIVALKTLVRDVKDIKENLKYLRKRIDEVEGRKLPRRPCNVQEDLETCDGGALDPKFWDRLTKRRQELLSNAEETFEIKRKKSVRFHPSVSVTNTTDSNQETAATSLKPVLSSVTIDKRLSNRIAKLETFLVEKKQTRLSEARKSVVRTILDPREAECEVHNTESALYRSQITSNEQSKEDRRSVEPFKKENYGDLNMCLDCKTDQRAKDKFWGLESESQNEDEYVRKVLSMRKSSHDATELKEEEANELFKKLNIEDKFKRGEEEDAHASRNKSKVVFQVPSKVDVQDSNSSKAYVIKRRPKGRAGRGTWVTPPYSPNWIVIKTQRSHLRLRTASPTESNKDLITRKRRNSHMMRKHERISEAKKSSLEAKQIFVRV